MRLFAVQFRYSTDEDWRSALDRSVARARVDGPRALVEAALTW